MSSLTVRRSREERFRKHLIPIYEAIGVSEDKVIRSLLASMPPGMAIPVHHDTGYWVQHTHRVHVAIDTGELVDFFVGPNEESMMKILFDEGRIVELNNQAKHAVKNNMDRWYASDLYLPPSHIVLSTERASHFMFKSIIFTLFEYYFGSFFFFSFPFTRLVVGESTSYLIM
jgi:hypothetical protein